MNQYIISPAAIEDLKEISDYFADQNIEAGEKLLDEFGKKCRYLTRFPHMRRNYKAIRPDLRGLPMSGYILFYRVLENEIEILRVLKGDRDLQALFEDES